MKTNWCINSVDMVGIFCCEIHNMDSLK